MNNTLIQILLVLLIIACILLIANFIRLYQILTDLSKTSNTIKTTFGSIAGIFNAWKQSAKTVSDVVEGIISSLQIIKKIKSDKEKGKEKGE